MMPLAPGWDDLDSHMHSYAAGRVAEIPVIAATATTGRADGCARTVAELTSALARTSGSGHVRIICLSPERRAG